MRLPTAPLALLVVLAACHARDAAPRVGQAWVRLSAVPGQPAAAYFTLRCAGRADRLIKVESALARRTDMHMSMGSGGMSGMAPLSGVDVAAGASVRFAPGGMHAMLTGLDPAVVPGTAVPLRFGFASGRTTEAEAKTVAAGDDAPY